MALKIHNFCRAKGHSQRYLNSLARLRRFFGSCFSLFTVDAGHFETEILHGIIVANVLDHSTDVFNACWQQSAHDIAPDNVAQEPSEIVMPGIAQKTAAVRQHAHKAAEQPSLGQGLNVSLHAVQLIIEPPTAAKLYLSGY